MCRLNRGATTALTAAMRPISIMTRPVTEIWELPYQSNVRPIAPPVIRDPWDPKGCVRECRLSMPALRMRRCKRQASRRLWLLTHPYVAAHPHAEPSHLQVIDGSIAT